MKKIFPGMLAAFMGGACSAQNVGIGTTTPTAKLEVIGDVRITGGSPAVGKVFTSDATGLGSWEPASSGFSLPYDATVAESDAFKITTTTNGGRAISGICTGTAAAGAGLYGRSSALSGYGIAGVELSPTGVNYGVFGSAASTTGFGVFGEATSVTGISTGVLGKAASATGFGGYFTNSAYGLALRTAVGGVRLDTLAGTGSRVVVADAAGNLSAKSNMPMFFVHRATALNTSAQITTLSYPNQLQSDILIVTHNFNPPGVTGSYSNHVIGVYWNGSFWTVFNEDFADIVDHSFNVMVVKQ